MAANTKKQNSKEKKNNATKKNNKEKPKDKGNKAKEPKKPKPPKKVKPKLLPLPKTKLKPKYRKKCGKDVACIYDEDSFRPTIDDIYHNLNSFGFMIDVPNETPHTKKSFKVKCKGIKNPKIYKEPKLDKKKFGFFLPKMNSSLYVAKQQDYDCYNPKKEIKRENLPLGKLCYRDLECKSKNCSNIKFLGLPGKCILPKNTDKITENGKCNYDKDCKQNLTCVNRKCVRKPRSVLNTVAMKKAKKQSKRNKTKGIVGSYTPSFIKKRLPSGVFSRTSSATNQNLVNLSNSDISELKDNENFYFDDKGDISKIDCQNDSYCRSIDKDSVCFKNKCVSINKRCNLKEINSCLSGTNKDKEKNCCDIKSRCVKLEDTNDGICINVDKLSKGNIGESCFENKNCKSNKCSNINRCIPSSGHGIGFNDSIPCENSIDCVMHDFGSNELVCKNKVCQRLDEIQNNSQEIFDECIESKQCKSKNCGLWNDIGPKPTYMALKDKKICLGKPDEVRKRLKQLKDKQKNIKEFYRTFNKNISELKNKLNNKLLFIHAGVYNNSLVIIKNNNSLFLGKILKTIHFNKKNGEKESSITIIYFDKTANFENFSDDYKNLQVICSDTNSVYYDYFSEMNNKKIRIDKIESNSVNLQNKFIFEYLCFILFGRRQTLFVPGFFGKYKETTKYYVFQDSIINLKEVDKDIILGIKYDKIGLYQNLSIPFRKINSNIFPVFIDFNDNKDKIQEFLDSLKAKSYYNVDEDLLSPNFELIYKGKNIKLEKENSYLNNFQETDIVNYGNITKTSIFVDVV